MRTGIVRQHRAICRFHQLEDCPSPCNPKFQGDDTVEKQSSSRGGDPFEKANQEAFSGSRFPTFGHQPGVDKFGRIVLSLFPSAVAHRRDFP